MEKANRISFYSDNYLTFDDRDNGKKADVRIVGSKSIENNRNQILNLGFFIKNGFSETYYKIYKKHVYIIEPFEQGEKYSLREVTINSSYHQE